MIPYPPWESDQSSHSRNNIMRFPVILSFAMALIPYTSASTQTDPSTARPSTKTLEDHPADFYEVPLTPFFNACTAPCWKRYEFCNGNEYYAPISATKKKKACLKGLLDCSIEHLKTC